MQFARKVQEPGRSRNLSCLMLRRAKATEDRWRHCLSDQPTPFTQTPAYPSPPHSPSSGPALTFPRSRSLFRPPLPPANEGRPRWPSWVESYWTKKMSKKLVMGVRCAFLSFLHQREFDSLSFSSPFSPCAYISQANSLALLERCRRKTKTDRAWRGGRGQAGVPVCWRYIDQLLCRALRYFPRAIKHQRPNQGSERRSRGD